MRYKGAAILLFAAVAILCASALRSDSLPDELLQGETYAVNWTGSTEAASFKVSLAGERTPLGGISRGKFQIPIAEGSAETQNITFRMPWIDSIFFTLRVKAFDASGAEVGLYEQKCRFRPRVMASRSKDGIYLDLHQKINQRLYIQESGVITRCYIVSSSMNYLFLPPNRHVAKPHDHAGIFRVVRKYPSYWSSSYNVAMPWALNYNSGHFIHATSRRYYRMLGRPASHGCNRLTRHDARELYLATPAGTRVEVIGPGG